MSVTKASRSKCTIDILELARGMTGIHIQHDKLTFILVSELHIYTAIFVAKRLRLSKICFLAFSSN